MMLVQSGLSPQVEEHNKELMFTIHLEEQNSPKDLHWDVSVSEKQLQILQVREPWGTGTCAHDVVLVQCVNLG